MFNWYVRDLVFKQNVEDYVSFVKKFTVPVKGLSWNISRSPLIVIDLRVNINYKRKTEKGKKKDSKNKTII